MARTAIGLAASLALLAGPALAGEGFLGVYAHDIDDQISKGHYEEGPQIVGGVRTAALDELAFLYRPRVHLIVGVSTRHGGTNYVASGLSWRFYPLGGERFYFEPGVGVALHDGHVNLPSPDEPGLSLVESQKRLRDWRTKLDLGSRVLFEPELTFGWKATRRMSVELSWIHLSHAQLAGRHNPGLGDFGVRAVYRYGVDR
jgi:hypothetical protein